MERGPSLAKLFFLQDQLHLVAGFRCHAVWACAACALHDSLHVRLCKHVTSLKGTLGLLWRR